MSGRSRQPRQLKTESQVVEAIGLALASGYSSRFAVRGTPYSLWYPVVSSEEGKAAIREATERHRARMEAEATGAFSDLLGVAALPGESFVDLLVRTHPEVLND